MASVSASTLLSYGTWHEYKRTDVSLTSQQELQLKSLTVVALCHNRAVVPYATLQAATDTPSVKELEHLLIHHCIYSGMLTAKLDQRAQLLHVHKSAPRNVSPEKFDRMISGLSAWLDQAQKVGYFLDGMERSLDEVIEKKIVAARAEKTAFAASKKERELASKAGGGGEGVGSLEAVDGDVPTKSDMKASVKKSKRKKRQMDVHADAVNLNEVADASEDTSRE